MTARKKTGAKRTARKNHPAEISLGDRFQGATVNGIAGSVYPVTDVDLVADDGFLSCETTVLEHSALAVE